MVRGRLSWKDRGHGSIYIRHDEDRAAREDAIREGKERGFL